MTLKSYKELRDIDITQFCDQREAKDEDGKKIQVSYLNWARCVDLLHENGADVVYFEPLTNKDGSTLFMTDVPFTDKNKQVNRCFEVRIRIVIDDLEFIQNFPLLNGIYVVRDDTINQLRISNAQARAFVKGVAIRTGLGFSLWLKEGSDLLPEEDQDDLYSHNLLKIKERVEKLITAKMDNGLSIPDICKELKVDEDQFNVYLKHYTILDKFEKAIRKL